MKENQLAMPGKTCNSESSGVADSGKWKQWLGLAAAQPFHVKLRVGAKNRVAGKSVRKARKIRTKEEDGQAAGGRRFI